MMNSAWKQIAFSNPTSSPSRSTNIPLLLVPTAKPIPIPILSTAVPSTQAKYALHVPSTKPSPVPTTNPSLNPSVTPSTLPIIEKTVFPYQNPSTAPSTNPSAIVTYSPITVNSGMKNRTNFCPRALAVLNGSMVLSNGLEGMRVKVAIHENTPAFYMIVNGTIGRPQGGFMLSLQQAIAQRGGFEFQYVLVPSKPPGMSWTIRLNQILPFVDMYGNNFYTDSVDRRSAGIGFTPEIVDASLVLVTAVTSRSSSSNFFGKNQDNSIETYFSFLAPFTNRLWMVILAIIVSNGVLHWLIDPSHHREKHITLFRSLYLSLVTFTGKESMEPEKPAGSVLGGTYSFIVLVIVAFYTANLASMSTSRSIKVGLLTSLETAGNDPICVLTGSTAAAVVQTYYPSVQLVQRNSVTELMDALNEQTCFGAVMTQSDWDVAQLQSESHRNCDVDVVGHSIRTFNGAWPYKVDFGEYCTSFMEVVLSNIIIGMTADGSLNQLYQSALSNAQNLDCSGVGAGIVPPKRIGISDMAGLFYIYAGCLILALLVHTKGYVLRYYRPNTLLPKPQSTDQDQDQDQDQDRQVKAVESAERSSVSSASESVKSIQSSP